MTVSRQPRRQDYQKDDGNFISPKPHKHFQRTSIQHWQLRDLIAAPWPARELFYVQTNNIRHLDAQTGQVSPVIKDLSFSPASFTVGHGYIAAGGQRSQLIVRALNGSWSAHTTVGGSINNALCISHHQGTDSVRLYVCNNDQSIKVFRLPDLERIANIPMPTPVNHTSVSPDGRRLAAVGDSNEVFLVNISNSGEYSRDSTFGTTNDGGFSCAWNQSSDKLACATQDGYVCVWDVRQQDKCARIPSTQESLGSKGAVRCVKFSPSGSMDLLIFSEHVNYFNVVDARTFDQRQSIRLNPGHQDEHISGLCFTADSKQVFVGLESGILEYDVFTKARRMFASGAFV